MLKSPTNGIIRSRLLTRRGHSERGYERSSLPIYGRFTLPLGDDLQLFRTTVDVRMREKLSPDVPEETRLQRLHALQLAS